MNEKTWTDQPDEVVAAPIIASSFTIHTVAGDTAQAEIRRRTDNRYYLTAGNLFGSETVLCDNATVVLETLGAMCAKVNHKPMTLPNGVYLVQNRKVA